MFRVDQKVVCIDVWPKHNLLQRIIDCWNMWRSPYTEPVKGQVYTVSSVYEEDGTSFLVLSELRDADPEYWDEGFYACGFRPVVERKTDISVFTEMLTKAPATIGAE